ncbi:MAG: NACHT domain-containing protein [Longimicrobiaceae bacterium]
MNIDFSRVSAERISVVVGAPAASVEREVMDQLLERVRNFWIEGVLEAAVPNGAPVPLHKSYLPDAVRHPLDDVARRRAPHAAPGLGEVGMARVFDDSERLLLVLGEPGGGKTISLLELARELNARAEADPREPVAVVFSLSTWARRQKRLVEWLVEELATRYYVSRAGARACLEKQQLVLLLDGLDEVEAAARAACVQAVFDYARETGVAGLAITCRTEEFRALGAPLPLNAAVCLHPFGDDQIAAYLAAAGLGAGPFRDVLLREGELRRLASSPLMLYVLTRAFAERPGDLWALTRGAPADALPDALFAAYVAEVQGRHPAAEGGATAERMEAVLAWVAVNLNRHGQTELAVEQLQPSWLAGRGQQWAYLAASRMVTIVLCDLAFGIVYLLLVGVPNLLASGHPAGEQIGTAVVVNFLAALAAGGALAGVVVAVVDTLRYEWRRRRSAPPGGGVVRGLFFLLAYTAAGAVLLATWDPIGGAYLGLLCGILRVRTFDRSLGDDIRPVEVISLSARGAWRGLLAGLRWWLATLAASLALFAGLSLLDLAGPLNGLVKLVLLALPVVAVAGVGFGAVRGGRLKTRSRPNQGIRRSMRSAAVAGAFGLGAGLLAVAVLVAFYGRSGYARAIVSALLSSSTPSSRALVRSLPASGGALGIIGLFAASIAVIAALWNGGLEVVRHYVLRMVIAASGAAPFRLVQLLDGAAQRILLQKVGGDYRFLHRNLQDYFAARLPPGAPAHATSFRPTDAPASTMAGA